MSAAAAASSGGDEKGTDAASASAEKEKRVRTILRRKEDEVKEMLAPEKDMREIDVLVSKIVAEVRALEARGGEQGAENSDYTFLAAVETAAQFNCPVCGNKKQSNFMLDSKQGDTICLGADGGGCGTVVQDHKVHEGSMYRKFEGEADRSHHGPAPNRLYSTAHNMRTWISEGKDANRLRNLAEDVEMGLSTVGKDERKTRTAYKDQMKREAFDLINHIAGNLDLHEVVTVRAKELFAGWRNVKEHVHQKHAVICACIISAYREIGTEELVRMFERREQQQGADGAGLREDPLYPYVCAVCKAGFNAAKALDFHQKEAHKSAVAKSGEVGGAGPPRPMSEWSLSDARGWLTRVVAALGLPAEHLEAICASLEKSLGAQEKGQRVGAKRKATRTAGQLLGMLSLGRFAELCGGNGAGARAAEKLHHETSRKRAERSRRDKSRVANYNAAQRQNQIVRKPWVARVSAELKTATARAATAAVAAESAAAAPSATATATPGTSAPPAPAPATTTSTTGAGAAAAVGPAGSAPAAAALATATATATSLPPVAQPPAGHVAVPAAGGGGAQVAPAVAAGSTSAAVGAGGVRSAGDQAVAAATASATAAAVQAATVSAQRVGVAAATGAVVSAAAVRSAPLGTGQRADPVEIDLLG